MRLSKILAATFLCHSLAFAERETVLHIDEEDRSPRIQIAPQGAVTPVPAKPQDLEPAAPSDIRIVVRNQAVACDASEVLRNLNLELTGCAQISPQGELSFVRTPANRLAAARNQAQSGTFICSTNVPPPHQRAHFSYTLNQAGKILQLEQTFPNFGNSHNRPSRSRLTLQYENGSCFDHTGLAPSRSSGTGAQTSPIRITIPTDGAGRPGQ